MSSTEATKVGHIKLETPFSLLGKIENALKDRWFDYETIQEFEREKRKNKNNVRGLQLLLNKIKDESRRRRQEYGIG